MNLGLLTVLVPTLTMAAPVPPVPLPPAPVLYVRMIAPEGTRVSFYPGLPQEQLLESPATVAMRPGYHYRLRLDNLPDDKQTPLFPSLEIRGSLHPPKGLNIAAHPVPLVLTEAEIEQIRLGAMVTKVLYLEDPEMAVGLQSTPDQPLQFEVASEHEALESARERGRMMVVFRVGGKQYAPDELARINVPGTILLPNEPVLPPAAAPPHFQPCFYPVYDPILGPEPATEECLHDGGDINIKLGIRPDGQLGGLDPSDASLEYTLGRDRRVATSNRVCVCVPRYVALRAILVPTGFLRASAAQVESKLEPTNLLVTQQPPITVEQLDIVELLRQPIPPRGIESRLGVHSWQGETKPEAFAQIDGVAVIGQLVETIDLTGYPCCKPLLLHKWVEPAYPQQIGEVITFYLRYRNLTNETMTKVVVSDNLTARLGYIPKSAKSDREATFTYIENDVGSVILRWEIAGELKPGQMGVVSFRARIR